MSDKFIVVNLLCLSVAIGFLNAGMLADGIASVIFKTVSIAYAVVSLIVIWEKHKKERK